MRYKQVFPEMNKCLSKNKSYRVIFHFEFTNIVKLEALLQEEFPNLPIFVPWTEWSLGIEGMLPLIHMTILQKFSRYYWLIYRCVNQDRKTIVCSSTASY